LTLHHIPAHLPFLDCLAAGVLAEAGGEDPARLSRVTILLPTRRSARALRTAFLKAAVAPEARGTGMQALLLPRMRALAGLSTEDADELALPALLDLPPAVEPLRRQAVLAGFVARWRPQHGGPGTPEQAWSLAGELATLLDEMALEERDLALLEQATPGELAARWLERLGALVPEQHARHWQVTLIFLRGVVEAWQDWLAGQGLLDIGMRRVQALRAQAREWQARPPEHPVVAAGIGVGGTIPAAAELLRVLALAPQGRVVLHGMDHMGEAAVWEAIGEAPTHPFSGQQRLLAALGATREDLLPWPGSAPAAVPPQRAALLGMALRPAAGLPAWQQKRPHEWQPALAGLELLTAPDAQAEAVAVALTLRQALETPGARAALVTPDRDLARRVAAELARWGVVADDSAGAPLGTTPAGAFLRLLARALAEELAPVPLLAVLKHPLCCGGMDRTDWMAAVRRLEWHALRGVRPGPGLAGLRAAAGAALRGERLAEQAAQVQALLAVLEAALPSPTPTAGTPAALLAALLAAAEALAATREAPGGLRLYSGEEGEALAGHLAGLQAALADAAPIAPEHWTALFEAAMANAVAPALHASRGRDATAHPRVEILGLLEARLLPQDVVVLGALDETVWPLATDPGPWMSRPMRRDFGLPEPEARIGRVAADFVLGACAAPRAVLSRALRRGGSPTVPARWLVRLETFLDSQGGLALPVSAAPGWAAALDAPARVQPCARPAPSPAERPDRLSVTEVETLIADPYAFYARRVLQLSPLDELDADVGAADYGVLVHDVMRRFVPRLRPWPGAAEAEVLWQQAVTAALAEAGVRPGFAAFWRPRLLRIGGFVLAEESAARGVVERSLVECGAAFALRHEDGRSVTLTARADRIDLCADGSLRILDYKTGTPPRKSQVQSGEKPQLTLEAALARQGAFRKVPSAEVAELLYWRLSGGPEPGRAETAQRGAQEIAASAEEALTRLRELAEGFLFGQRPFTARPHPLRAPAGGDYDHLSRLAEWSAGEEGE
jgi:ATP-dependent helicase/nuclease subunit B